MHREREKGEKGKGKQEEKGKRERVKKEKGEKREEKRKREKKIVARRNFFFTSSSNKAVNVFRHRFSWSTLFFFFLRALPEDNVRKKKKHVKLF